MAKLSTVFSSAFDYGEKIVRYTEKGNEFSCHISTLMGHVFTSIQHWDKGCGRREGAFILYENVTHYFQYIIYSPNPSNGAFCDSGISTLGCDHAVLYCPAPWCLLSPPVYEYYMTSTVYYRDVKFGRRVIS